MVTQLAAEKRDEQLSELVNYYELCNRAEAKSEKTITWYSANLKRFLAYLENRHNCNSLKDVNLMLLRDYVLYLFKQHRFENHPFTPQKADLLSAASIHGHVRTLRAFFSWLHRESFVETNVAENLKLPKLTQRVIETLSDQEIFSIIRTFDPKVDAEMRNQTIFMLLVDTGLRIGELVNLKLVDINMRDGLIKVMGKGKKERIVPVGSNAMKMLQRYLFRHRPSPANASVENVFLSIHGIQLTENGVKLVFARLAEKSGVRRLHAHLCRHTFATRYLVNGGDIFTLQMIMGHSTLEMVRHYANLASSHVALQHQKYSPMDHLNLRKR